MSHEKRQINLMRGWPSPDVLPASLLSTACQRILVDRNEYTPILQYGPSAGHHVLREELSKWLGEHYQASADPDRICVTGGASQGLSCILQSFTDPNYTTAVWVIAPCYYLACGIFEDAGFAGKLRATPEDEEGIDLIRLETSIINSEEEQKGKPALKPLKVPGPTRKLYRHVIYAVPTSGNPSGKTMPLQRREGLVRLARKYNALVVCDDVYDFLQWPLDYSLEQNPCHELRLPRLCDIERTMGYAEQDSGQFGYTVSNGSFSKISGPGVRTGWVEASPNFVIGLGNTASTLSGGAPSQLCAAMLGEMLRTGDLQKHIHQTVCPSLQRRHKIAMDAIHQHITPLGFHARETSLLRARVYGGYFIWLTPADGVTLNSRLVAEVAVQEESLIIGYGNIFEVHGDESHEQFSGAIRICFAWEPEEALIEGIERLGKLLKRFVRDAPQYQDAHFAYRSANFIESYK